MRALGNFQVTSSAVAIIAQRLHSNLRSSRKMKVRLTTLASVMGYSQTRAERHRDWRIVQHEIYALLRPAIRAAPPVVADGGLTGDGIGG